MSDVMADRIPRNREPYRSSFPRHAVKPGSETQFLRRIGEEPEGITRAVPG